jgi:diguanylate cyclase (GGDEF)-like protein
LINLNRKTYGLHLLFLCFTPILKTGSDSADALSAIYNTNGAPASLTVEKIMDQSQLVKRQEPFVQELTHKTAEIYQVWQQIQIYPENSALWQLMMRLSHDVAELSSRCSCAHVADAARQLEQHSKIFELQTEHGGFVEQVTPLVVALAQSVRADFSLSEEDFSQTLMSAKGQVVFFIGNDAHEGAELGRQLGFYDYSLTVFTEQAQILHAIERMLPTCFIVSLHTSRQKGFDLMKALQARNSAIPMIVLATEGATELRLLAVRAGAKAYFVPPVNITRMVDTLDRLTGKNDHIPFRILIVNGSETAAAYYALSLQAFGMHTAIVTQPLAIMRIMVEFDPDLVLMNLHLPQCSGSELAEVIRQQEAYMGTPIIFLSAETNTNVELHAIQMKGDELLVKPININHLIAVVRHRAQHFRQIKALIVRDSLTGLYNHSHIKELLQRELSLAHRNNQPLQFVMIDLDHFKLVNDHYGHLTGDIVIKLLARLLKQRLRTTDILGRYGGEEFALILPNTTAEQAEKIINMIRQHFSELAIATEQGECKVTFSAGVASYPAAAASSDHSNAIVQAADEALYQSKNAGRNCVTLARN